MNKKFEYKFQLGEEVKINFGSKKKKIYPKDISVETIKRCRSNGIVQEQIIKESGEIFYVLRLFDNCSIVAEESALEQFEQLKCERLTTGDLVVVNDTQELCTIAGFWGGSTALETYKVRKLSGYGSIDGYHRSMITVVE